MTVTEIKKELICDFCGKHPGSWFGETSVVVCSNNSCQVKAQASWERHCEDLDTRN